MESFRHKTWRIALLAVLFMSIVCVSWSTYCLFHSSINPNTTSPIIISVDKSTSATQLMRQLKEKKLIQSTQWYLSLIRFEGLSQQLKAGVYEVRPGESALQLIHRIVAGDVLTLNFTIIAGTTQSKIAQDLMHASYLEYHPEDWALVQDNHLNAEGLLLADTYQYRGGSSSKTLLEQAHQYLMDYVKTSWASRTPDLPYKTPYELVIAASIIEKESARPEERKLISGVMVNRLKKGMPLQMDPTVIYGLGSDYKGKLTHNDLLIDSPYNSYRYRGLPPTPITTVGKESIDAAAHPQASNYLYFVAKGDGTHQFSETYLQQRQAIEQYQRKDT
ncbi:MAG: endolytic transglycosylase MltG [Legionellales bacterium]